MLTLYDAARCPYCARVRIVLAEKGVEWETVEIDLENRPGWLYEKNPAGKVPVLEEDGWVLPESAVISEYVNERYPGAAALAGRPGRTGRRTPARLPLRRLLGSLLRPAPREGGSPRALRARARVPRLAARDDAVVVRTGFRPRRQRLPALDHPCSRPARRRARPVLGALPLARARSRATIDRGRARARGRAEVTGDVERDELRAPARRERPDRPRCSRRGGVRRTGWALRATRGKAGSPARRISTFRS